MGQGFGFAAYRWALPQKALVADNPNPPHRVAGHQLLGAETERDPAGLNGNALLAHFHNRRQGLDHLRPRDINPRRTGSGLAAVLNDGANQVRPVEGFEAVGREEERLFVHASVDVVPGAFGAAWAGVVVAAGAPEHPFVICTHKEGEVGPLGLLAIGVGGVSQFQGLGLLVHDEPLVGLKVVGLHVRRAGGLELHAAQVKTLLALGVVGRQQAKRQDAKQQLFIQADARRIAGAAQASQRPFEDAHPVLGAPGVDGVVVAAAAEHRAIAEQGERREVAVVTKVAAVQVEAAGACGIHIDLDDLGAHGIQRFRCVERRAVVGVQRLVDGLRGFLQLGAGGRLAVAAQGLLRVVRRQGIARAGVDGKPHHQLPPRVGEADAAGPRLGERLADLIATVVEVQKLAVAPVGPGAAAPGHHGVGGAASQRAGLNGRVGHGAAHGGQALLALEAEPRQFTRLALGLRRHGPQAGPGARTVGWHQTQCHAQVGASRCLVPNLLGHGGGRLAKTCIEDVSGPQHLQQGLALAPLAAVAHPGQALAVSAEAEVMQEPRVPKGGLQVAGGQLKNLHVGHPACIAF